MKRTARIDRLAWAIICVICIGGFTFKCVDLATTKKETTSRLEDVFSVEMQNQNANLAYDFHYESNTQSSISANTANTANSLNATPNTSNTTDEAKEASFNFDMVAVGEQEIGVTTDSELEFVNVSTFEVTTEEATEATTEEIFENEKVYSTRLNRYITSDEMYFLTMICVSESGVEDYTGKVAVVATVLNRLESPTYPNTVYGVIFDPFQFSSATDGVFHNGGVVLHYEDIPEETIAEAKAAVLAALDGVDPTWEVGGALFFYNPDYCSEEENAKRANISETLRIGNHVFYRVWD